MIWQTQKAKGDKGEAIVKNYFSSSYSIVDVSNDSAYGEKDIDCFMDNVPVEIKTDYRISKTGNLFLEYEIEHYEPIGLYKTQYSKTTAGYIKQTEAKGLFYYDYWNDILRAYKLADIRQYLDSHYCSSGKREDIYENGYTRKIYGYLANAEDIPHFKFYNLKENKHEI